MAGLFSGVASRALNQGIVDYTTALEATRRAGEGLDAADRRQRDAVLLKNAGLSPAGQTPATDLSLPPPAALNTPANRDAYTVGTILTPQVGITPPGGAPALAPAGGGTPAGTPAQQAGTSFIAADGSVITPSIGEWANMTAGQKAAHLKAVNDKRGSERAPVVLETGKGRRLDTGPRKAPITLEEYEASLPRRAMDMQNFSRSAPGRKPPPARVVNHSLAAAVQSPQGKKIMDYARAIGVNPAVAMAHYGVESSFGKNSRSWDDAKRTGAGWGVLQVIPDTQRRTTEYFSRPEVLQKYPNEANNINALVRMARDDPATEDAQIAAGILQMKYIQDIGITDESLMGAAYHANPHKVLKAGAPVNATDGKISNADHSSKWNAMFSQATAELGGAGPTPGTSQPTAPTAQAGLVASQSTGNSSFDSRVRYAVAKPTSEYDYQTQQFMQARTQQVQIIQRKQQMLEQEQRQVTAAYNNANQRFNAHKAAGDVVGMTAAMDEAAAAEKLNLDIQNRTLEFSSAAQSSINQYNDQLIANEADRAVRDLNYGDPSRASLLTSQAGGTQRIYQPRSDGGYSIIDQNGRYVLDENGQAKQFTNAEIAFEVYSVADRAKAAEMSAGESKYNEKKLDHALKMEEKQQDMITELAKITIKGEVDLKQKLMEMDADIAKVEADPSGSGKLFVFYKGTQGKILQVDPAAFVTTPDGTQIPSSAVTVLNRPGLRN